MSKKRGYREWIIVFTDYCECLTTREAHFEFIIPLVCAFSLSLLCALLDLSIQAVSKLNDLLPNVLSIIIGFTISAIAIIISTTEDSNKVINKEIKVTICGTNIKFKQWFLVNLVYYTIFQIALLLFTFIAPLVIKILSYNWAIYSNLFVYIYAIMRIFLGIIKVITKLYRVFYKDS